MSIRTQALLLSTLVTLILAIVVWNRKERSRTTLPFSLVNLILMIHGAAYVALKLTGQSIFLRAVIASAVFMLPGYLFLTYSYLFRQNRLVEGVLIAMFGAAAVFSVTAYIPSVDSALRLMSYFPPGSRDLRAGLAVLAVALPSLAVVIARQFAEKEPLLRRRYWGLLAAGGLVTAICAADQRMGGGPWGPVAQALFHYYLYQTIVRFQSFDPGRSAGRLAVLTASSMLLLLVYGLFFFFLQKPTPILLLFHTVVAAFLLMVMIYDPFLSGLEARAREMVTRGRVDYSRRIDDLVAELSKQFSLEDIGAFLTRRVPEALGLNGAAVYLTEEGGGMSRLSASRDAPDRIDSETARAVQQILREPMGMDDLYQLTFESYPGPEQELSLKLIGLLKSSQGRWLLPMRHQGELIGLYIPSVTALPDARGASARVLAALADLAAVRIVNANIYEQLRSRDRLATLGEMAAMIAHEIRNPLASMKGAALYLADGELPASAGEFIHIIVEEADRLNGVLTRFLDYVRPFELRLADVDINQLMRGAAALLAEGEKPGGVAFRLDLDESLGVRRVDGEQLRQVLINLVKNAQQAQPGGGEILVRSLGTRDGFTLEVADRGPGIGPTVHDKLFMPFFTTKKSGSGLGLMISQRIVHAHQGRIYTRPREGGGSRFLVEIPSARIA